MSFALSRWLREVAPSILIIALLGAVYLLPPDTSLSEVKAAGALSVCVPTTYPPLVTGNASAPGIDVEILRGVAKDLGVTLQLSQNQAMGQDFNPRNWGLTRAQCEVVAGGVVASPTTQSFLETTDAYAETGWAMVSAQPVGDLHGQKIGIYTGISGLDRLALSRLLRAAGAVTTITSTPDELADGLSSGRFDIAISEALLAAELATAHHWSVAWVPGAGERYPLVFGLWKGDLTLKRAVEASLARMQSDGTIAAILARYLRDDPLLKPPLSG